MTSAQLLSLGSLRQLVNRDGLYLIGFGWLFGMSVWISFFGGVIAFRALPRHQFGALQHKTFPVYFLSSIGLSAALLALWIQNHPNVLNFLAEPRIGDVAQVYALATVMLAQASNYFIVGPMTSKVMFKRHRQEKEEGVAYNDPKASGTMKGLNRQFGLLHGISSLANIAAIIALTFHGLWLGTASKGF